VLALSWCLCFAAGIAGADDIPGAAEPATIEIEPATPAAAVDDEPEPKKEWKKDWSVELTPYIWAASITGDITVRNTTTPVSISTIDILENLGGMALADLTIHYKRFGVLADGAWLKVGTTVGLPVTAPYTTAKVDIGTAFGTAALSYRFHPREGLTVDPYIGARWWRINPDLKLSGAMFLPNVKVSPVDSWADPVVGLRLRYDITDTWYLRFLADGGAGVSKYQWQGMLGGGYSFKDWFGLEIGYRVMGVDYKNSSGFRWDVIMKGLQFNFNFRF
jgi:hypothetical protein